MVSRPLTAVDAGETPVTGGFMPFPREVVTMSLPGLVEASLGEEAVAAKVPLGGDDELYVTPKRTLVYRSEGLLSDESIEEYPHDAERVTLKEGRRKATISLDYGLDGTRSLTIPGGKLDAVLHPVLAGVLNAADVTEPGETVLETFRFSELTIVVTSDRIVKHIGGAVWDEEFEEFPFEAATGLDFEEGSVAMQVVLSLGGRQERFKAPTQDARALRERIESALFAYYDVSSLEELNETIAPEGDEDVGGGGSEDRPDPREAISFDAVEPLSASPSTAAEEREMVGEPDRADRPGSGIDEAGTAVDGTVTPEADPSTGAGADSDGEPTVGDADGNGHGDGDGVASQASGADSTAAASVDPQSEAPSNDGDGDAFADAGFEPAAGRGEAAVLERLEALSTRVDRQTELLEAQQRTIQQLIEELRRLE